MKKSISLMLVFFLILSVLLTGCTTNKTADLQKQVNTLQQENNRLQQDNNDLSDFRTRVAIGLSNVQQTLYNLKSQGYLPFAGASSNDPQLFNAIEAVKKLAIQTQGNEIVLSMMPKEWSADYSSILMVYDVFSPAPDAATKGAAGTITTMAGAYKNTNGTWQQVKFTRAYKSDGSFTLKNM